VKVNLGAHGQLQGLGVHWELWMLAQGGMKPIEALQAATIQGAAYLGMDQEIGSLKAGKLADLIVLDKNPLENIQNSNSLVYTMANGRLYDSNTMNQSGMRQRTGRSFTGSRAVTARISPGTKSHIVFKDPDAGALSST